MNAHTSELSDTPAETKESMSRFAAARLQAKDEFETGALKVEDYTNLKDKDRAGVAIERRTLEIVDELEKESSEFDEFDLV